MGAPAPNVNGLKSEVAPDFDPSTVQTFIMPLTRCLTCGGLIDSKLTRHPECRKAVKDERNRQANELGPCPQDGVCGYCREPAEAHGKGPLHWGHWPTRFIDGGTTVVPMHKLCNEKYMRTGKK